MIADSFAFIKDSTLEAKYTNYNDFVMQSGPAPWPANQEYPVTVKTSWKDYASDGGVLYGTWMMFDRNPETFWHPGGYADNQPTMYLPCDIDLSFLGSVLFNSLGIHMHKLDLGNQYWIKDFEFFYSQDYKKWTSAGKYSVKTHTPDHTETFNINLKVPANFFRMHVTSNYPTQNRYPYDNLISIGELFVDVTPC